MINIEKENQNQNDKDASNQEKLRIKDLIDTGILTDANLERFISLVMSQFAGKSLKLMFQATKHGFAAEEFHKKCDGMQPTVVLIKAANNRTFGGVTALTWEGGSAS